MAFLGDKEAIEAARRKTAEELAAFESSDFLRGLRERSEANREKNKKDIFNKYCQRQAEMGVGDCKPYHCPLRGLRMRACMHGCHIIAMLFLEHFSARRCGDVLCMPQVPDSD